MTAIESRDLGKRYGRKWALRHCTLAIPAGRVVALVGPNGAGKTTFLHTAVGLTAPTAGAIAVLGGLAPGSDGALARIGFVAQDTPLYPHLSVGDTLTLVRNLSARWDEADALRRLADLGIPLEQKVGRLSGGQHAQVALAVTLARHPELLILDEPLARLDPLARHDFMGTLMATVAEEGTSIIFSSHVVAELERISDYLIVLSDGHLQVSGDVDSLLESHRVLAGPTSEVERLKREVAVVHERTAGRQTNVLIRTPSAFIAPEGWQVLPTNLEELVLSYLRSPEAAMMSGPVPIGRPRPISAPT
jgi:ABC-2 type transport system ATP-binding protein